MDGNNFACLVHFFHVQNKLIILLGAIPIVPDGGEPAGLRVADLKLGDFAVMYCHVRSAAARSPTFQYTHARYRLNAGASSISFSGGDQLESVFSQQRNSEGIFITQSALGIVPVTTLDGEPVAPSPLLDLVLRAYHEMLAKP